MTTAFYTHKGGARTLLTESSEDTLGGAIRTRRKYDNGKEIYLWEDGPNTFQASAKCMLKLAKDLELNIISSDPKLPKFIYSSNDGELYAVPGELPKLLSIKGLLRAIGGLIVLPVKSKEEEEDESIASFVSRVLGDEVLDKVVEPVLSTIYTGDPTQMSLSAVFPFFGDLAAAADDTPGGLLHCYVMSKKIQNQKKIDNGKNISWNQVDAGKDLLPPRDDDTYYGGALPDVPKGASLSFNGGLQALPNAVRSKLGDDICRLGWKAISIQPSFSASSTGEISEEDNISSDNDDDKEEEEGATATTTKVKEKNDSFDVRFETSDGEEKIVRATAVVVSTPPSVSASLLSSFLMPASASYLSTTIQTPPVVAITLAIPKTALSENTKATISSEEEATPNSLNGFGILIPRPSKKLTLGYQFITSLFPSRAPNDDTEVILAYIGGEQCNLNLDKCTDDILVKNIIDDAQGIILKSKTENVKVLSVHRWKNGTPQYGIGHSKCLEDIREKELPRTKQGGIFLGGAGAGGGISLGDCAENGYAVARSILETIRYRNIVTTSQNKGRKDELLK